MAALSSERPEVPLRRRAMDYLARREHSFSELLQKLADAFPEADSELCMTVLEKLREENLQSDWRFAEALLRSRSQRGQGPVRIRYELRQREVSEGLIDEAFRLAEIDWYTLCEQVMTKRFGAAVPSEGAERQRYWRFLAQRGFDTEQIGTALKSATKHG